MKAILEFNLPEEQEELNYALKGHLYSIIIDDFDNELRKRYKYENQDSISIEEARDILVRLKDEYEI